MTVKDDALVFLLNEQVKGHVGIYERNGKEEYFKSLDPTISEGDIVVVTSGNARLGFSTVKIVKADVNLNLETDKPIRWIVGRVDLPAYETIVALEDEAIQASRAAQHRAQRNKLREDMRIVADENMKNLPLVGLGAKKE